MQKGNVVGNYTMLNICEKDQKWSEIS